MVKIGQYNEDDQGMVNVDVYVLKARVRAFIEYNVLNVRLNKKSLNFSQFENLFSIFTLAQKIDARASHQKN